MNYDLERIKAIHTKTRIGGGGTDGFCAECGHLWPCPTFHVAAGWGHDSFYECEAEGWCSHEGVKF